VALRAALPVPLRGSLAQRGAGVRPPLFTSRGVLLPHGLQWSGGLAEVAHTRAVTVTA